MKKLAFIILTGMLLTSSLFARDYSFTRSFLFYQKIFGGASAKVNILTIIDDIKKKNLIKNGTDEFRSWITKNKGKKFYTFVIKNEPLDDKVRKKFTKFYEKGRIPKTKIFLLKLWNGYIPAGCQH